MGSTRMTYRQGGFAPTAGYLDEEARQGLEAQALRENWRGGRRAVKIGVHQATLGAAHSVCFGTE